MYITLLKKKTSNVYILFFCVIWSRVIRKIESHWGSIGGKNDLHVFVSKLCFFRCSVSQSNSVWEHGVNIGMLDKSSLGKWNRIFMNTKFPSSQQASCLLLRLFVHYALLAFYFCNISKIFFSLVSRSFTFWFCDISFKIIIIVIKRQKC